MNTTNAQIIMAAMREVSRAKNDAAQAVIQADDAIIAANRAKAAAQSSADRLDKVLAQLNAIHAAIS